MTVYMYTSLMPKPGTLGEKILVVMESTWISSC